MYLSYDAYVDMGGTLDETTFEDFEFEAEAIVNWYTFDRLKYEEAKNLPKELERCMFRLIQLAKLKADVMNSAVGGTGGIGWTSSSKAEGQTIASQSNDGVSISYNMITASEAFGLLNAKSRGGEVEQTVQRYLHGVVNSLGRKVLFRGFYPGE